MPRFLPREGLTWEAIFGFINHSALEPLITGPLLLSLLYYPGQVLVVASPNTRRFIESAAFVSTVKVLLGCGIVRRINNFLSRVVLNNLTSDVWNTGKEIVVVTGASGGMGAAISREVAKTSASVIALDLYPPAQQFRKLFLPLRTELPFLYEPSSKRTLLQNRHQQLC
jgi:all-trans-retinol dehydrogenase (NAD+)